MASTTTVDTHARWLRSEVALAAARGALIGWGVLQFVQFLRGREDAITLGRIGLLFIPFTILYLAGSPKFLAWLASVAGDHIPALKSGWMDNQRLFLGWLSGRTLLTVIVLAFLCVFFSGGAPRAHGSDALDAVGNILIAGSITYAWAVGLRRGSWGAARYGAIVGVIMQMLITYFGVKLFSNSTPIWELGGDSGIGLPTNLIIAIALRPVIYAVTAGYALERLTSAASFQVRVVGSLIVAVILTQALSRWIDMDILAALLFAIGWGVGIIRAHGAHELLTPQNVVTDVAPSPAAPGT